MGYTLAALSLIFWVKPDETNKTKERMFADLIGNCPLINGCGGKLYRIIEVGYIEDGRYFIKNPGSLRETREFNPQLILRCTNCKKDFTFPQEIVDGLSRFAQEFAENLRRGRKTAKAQWN